MNWCRSAFTKREQMMRVNGRCGVTDEQLRQDPKWAPLMKIEDWLEEHGWDKMSSPEFQKWLKDEGLDGEITIHCCQMPEEL